MPSQFSIVCEIYVFSCLRKHQKSKVKDIIIRVTTYHMCRPLVNYKGTTTIVKPELLERSTKIILIFS